MKNRDAEIKEHMEYVGEGWHPIIITLHKALMGIDPDYRILQVKEKFGGLRYYFSTSFGMSEPEHKRMTELVRFSENLTFRICEACGKPGKQGGKFWIRTACEEHHRDKGESNG